MDLLNGAVRPIYLKYLGAAFGSACISSIYGLVDLAAMGQYHGPSGTAARSVVMPVFNIVYSLGLLLGIGGSVLTLLVLLTHFLSPKNTLRLTPIPRFPAQLGAILTTGFSTFFVDLAMGIVTVLFNRQVLTYLGTDALAVYGVIMNISNFVQCCAYSVGQAAQPILSINFGVVWTALVLAVPNWFIRAFMAPTAAVLAIAPAIMRCYGLSFLLLPFNVFSTYYFQSIMQPGVSFVISVARGLVVSGGLILLLPALASGSAVWLAMPITELAVAGYVAWQMKRLHLG